MFYPCRWGEAAAGRPVLNGAPLPAALPTIPAVPQDNGLKLSNSWEGHSVLLNPDYKAQVGRCRVNWGEGGRL